VWELDVTENPAWPRGVPYVFPDEFPIRTVNPLRVAIIEPKTIGVHAEKRIFCF
jgi:hypothetical protein